MNQKEIEQLESCLRFFQSDLPRSAKLGTILSFIFLLVGGGALVLGFNHIHSLWSLLPMVIGSVGLGLGIGYCRLTLLCRLRGKQIGIAIDVIREVQANFGIPQGCGLVIPTTLVEKLLSPSISPVRLTREAVDSLCEERNISSGVREFLVSCGIFS